MSSETITRSQLVEAIYQGTGVTRSESTLIFDTLIETIGSLLKEKGEVKINRFGSFVNKQKAQRVGRNPKTGQEVIIPEHYAVSFKPALALKTSVEAQELKKAA
ncbi:MAG: integration host factor subunit alpha [Alphaproteobacteria bacterium]|jgi:integration host factor subunit alpha